MHAYVNPDRERKERYRDHGYVPTTASGHGIVRFNVKDRTITMECWPRSTHKDQKRAEQYLGFPITITQEDNYGRKAKAYLPTLQIKGQTDPVVQVIHEDSKEIVYTLRIKGNTFRPKVFEEGTYTVKVGEGTSSTTLQGVKAIGLNEEKSIEVNVKPSASRG
jgi:alkaline phosphatase D